MSQRVVYPDSPFHAIAWRDCLAWAIENPEIRTAFMAETRIAFPNSAQTPIDHMVDAATGRDEFVIQRFIEWFNRMIWGADPFISGIPTFSDPSDPES